MDARLGERDHLAVIWLAAAALVAGAAIVWLGREGTFFHDDLWYLCGRSLTDVASWFRPHNEHWVTLHVIAYMGIAAVFGTNYLAFQVGLVAAHLAAVAGLFVLVDRRVSRPAAAGTAGVLLLFGSGYLALFWAFEIGFIGAIAFGLWALVVLPARPWLAAGLLLAGVATGGSALPFVAAAFVLVALERGPRAAAPLLIPALSYAAFVAIAVEGTRGTFSAAGAPGYFIAVVVAGVGAAVGIGLPGMAGALGAAVLARPRAPSPLLWTGLAGLITTAGILSVARQGFGAPDSPHYLYAMAPFVLMIGADVFGRARRPRIIVPVLAIAIGVNAALLVSHGQAWGPEVAAAVAAGANEIPAGVCYPATPAR